MPISFSAAISWFPPALTALSRVERGVTQAIVNADLQPTASFVMNPDIDFEMNAMQGALRDAIGDKNLDIIDATGIASALMGDSIATNAFMLGFAFQKGGHSAFAGSYPDEPSRSTAPRSR